MRKLSLYTLGIVVAALALVACGGDDSQDEDEITAAIELAATSGDPAACTEAQTQRFTEQTTNQTGKAAVKQCEKDAADTPAESIEVSGIAVDGDSATAEGAITGSFFDSQTIAVALVKEDGEWKLDELTGFVEFNRDAFTAAFEDAISSEEGAPPEAVDCATQQIEAQSDQQLQDFLLGTDPKAEDRIFRPCSKLFPEESSCRRPGARIEGAPERGYARPVLQSQIVVGGGRPSGERGSSARATRVGQRLLA